MQNDARSLPGVTLAAVAFVLFLIGANLATDGHRLVGALAEVGALWLVGAVIVRTLRH